MSISLPPRLPDEGIWDYRRRMKNLRMDRAEQTIREFGYTHPDLDVLCSAILSIIEDLRKPIM